MTTTLRADLAPACPVATLTNYLQHQSSTVGAPNGPCSVGILNYSGFEFDSSFANSPSALLGTDNFELSPITPGQSGNTGFTISPNGVSDFNLTSGSATYVLDWYFAIDAGPIAGGASLGMDPTGDVSVTAEYCVDSYITAFVAGHADACYDGPANNPDPSVQSLTVTPNQLNASIIFTTPAYQFADVRTIISLNADNGPATFDGSTSGTYLTPEPVLLVPGALIGLMALIRKRSLKPGGLAR